jgi:hypothetical protein
LVDSFLWQAWSGVRGRPYAFTTTQRVNTPPSYVLAPVAPNILRAVLSTIRLLLPLLLRSHCGGVKNATSCALSRPLSPQLHTGAASFTPTSLRPHLRLRCQYRRSTHWLQSYSEAVRRVPLSWEEPRTASGVPQRQRVARRERGAYPRTLALPARIRGGRGSGQVLGSDV